MEEKKFYSVNPVYKDDAPTKFNHVDIFLEENGTLKLDGLFVCKKNYNLDAVNGSK